MQAPSARERLTALREAIVTADRVTAPAILPTTLKWACHAARAQSGPSASLEQAMKDLEHDVRQLADCSWPAEGGLDAGVSLLRSVALATLARVEQLLFDCRAPTAGDGAVAPADGGARG